MIKIKSKNLSFQRGLFQDLSQGRNTAPFPMPNYSLFSKFKMIFPIILVVHLRLMYSQVYPDLLSVNISLNIATENKIFMIK